MSTRALTLALRLLTTAVVGTALVTVEAGCCGDPWSDPVEFSLDTSVDLNAAAIVGPGEVLVGTADGKILLARTDPSLAEPTLTRVGSAYTGTAAIHAMIAEIDDVWAAGDNGTLLRRPPPVGEELTSAWEKIALGTSARLLALARFGEADSGWLVVVGDKIMRVIELETGTVITPPTPEGGWGQLRAVFGDGDRIYAAGAGGVAWTCEDPTGEWTATDLGLGGRDINGGGPFGALLVAVADDGRYAIREGGSWEAIDGKVASDFVGYAQGLILARDGRVYELAPDGSLDRLTKKANGSDRGIAFDGTSAVVVGEGGRGRSFDYFECIGGRPFVVDGEARIASVLARLDWCGAPDPGLELDPELAAAWLRDALAEHASVASFAKFAAELLALAAPPELIAEATRAAVDEIEHARLCFGLARRYGATEPGPGPLAVGSRSRPARVDPVAVALALFDEGCVNETLAACEAAVAAAGCRDAQARAVLERIAIDERRHAVFAWRCLGWLLEAHGERVGPALRRHVARRPAIRVAADAGVARPAAGRLGPAERARVHGRCIREAITPLVGRLIGGGGAARLNE